MAEDPEASTTKIAVAPRFWRYRTMRKSSRRTRTGLVVGRRRLPPAKRLPGRCGAQRGNEAETALRGASLRGRRSGVRGEPKLATAPDLPSAAERARAARVASICASSAAGIAAFAAASTTSSSVFGAGSLGARISAGSRSFAQRDGSVLVCLGLVRRGKARRAGRQNVRAAARATSAILDAARPSSAADRSRRAQRKQAARAATRPRVRRRRRPGPR